MLQPKEPVDTSLRRCDGWDTPQAAL